MIEQLEKEKQKKGEQVQQAHADLARQAALIKDLQGHPRGKKEPKPPGVPAEQVHIPTPCPCPPHPTPPPTLTFPTTITWVLWSFALCST